MLLNARTFDKPHIVKKFVTDLMIEGNIPISIIIRLILVVSLAYNLFMNVNTFLVRFKSCMHCGKMAINECRPHFSQIRTPFSLT